MGGRSCDLAVAVNVRSCDLAATVDGRSCVVDDRSCDPTIAVYSRSCELVTDVNDGSSDLVDMATGMDEATSCCAEEGDTDVGIERCGLKTMS